ncbi:hypothetical protein [Pseudomonas oryzihabitans]|uniref:Uncharacterized protein n=1 Tax=Pseudomonas oryzihabitans TaxID=47885 RepID=A0A2Z5AES9_9PSED|nr:hypothetical protein [Pseudomonas oryzihabitans]AXA67790.1 hypothetical protein CE139_18875 [Pseudomonas oryzihabitans]
MTAFPRKQPPVDFKTQYSLSFTAQENEIVVDFFCGGGAGTRHNVKIRWKGPLKRPSFKARPNNPNR